MAEDFAGAEVDDGDGGLVGDGEDAFAVVGASDAEVVHASGSPEADLAAGVDAVVAEPEVVSVCSGGSGFGERVVDLGGGLASEGAVGSVVVVEVGEGVQEGLQLARTPTS